MEIPGWNGPGGMREQLDGIKKLTAPKNPGDAEIIAAAVKLYRLMQCWSPESRKTIDAFDPKVSGDLGDFQIEVGLHLQRAGRR